MITDPSVNFAWFPLENPGIVSIPLAFFLGWLGSVTSKNEVDAVSYTHLDVYKRQVLHRRVGVLRPAERLGHHRRLPLGRVLPGHRRRRRAARPGWLPPVSYTHLDVYKRQKEYLENSRDLVFKNTFKDIETILTLSLIHI